MRIALYQPDIPQNTGNIFRLAACLGVSVDVIDPAGFFFNDKRLQRSLMDYVDHLSFKRHVDWKTFYQWRIAHNYRLILSSPKDGAFPQFEAVSDFLDFWYSDINEIKFKTSGSTSALPSLFVNYSINKNSTDNQ